MDTDTFKKLEKDNVIILFDMQPLRRIWFFTYTSSEDEYVKVPCRISEKRYKIRDGYKVTLESLYPEFGKKDVYISDLCTIINDGHAEIYTRI